MFKIPLVTKNLLIINVIAYLLMSMLRSVDLNGVFGLHFLLAPDFHYYQLFSYMFMHASLQHIFFNMFALWMFGCVVENVWGPKKFLFYYIACGVGAGLFQEMAQMVQFYSMAVDQYPDITLAEMSKLVENSGAVLNQWTTVGASGAIYGVLLAFGMIFPEERIFIFPLPIPIKAKWFVMIYAVIEVFAALSSSGDGVAHLAHLGGMVIGFFMIRYWQKNADKASRMKNKSIFGGIFSDMGGGLKGNGWKRHGGGARENTDRHNADWDYNARQKAHQDEIDRILDKIRRSGYDSLTRDEKQTLFDSSNK